MPISDQEIAELGRRGYKPLFEDQFRSMPPRHFPEVLDRHTIPPIQGQLVDQTKTPVYVLGWMTTSRDFASRYQQPGGATSFAEVRIELRARWTRQLRGTEKSSYEIFAPDVLNKGFEGHYVLRMLGNYSEKHLRQSLNEDYVRTAMEFLNIEEPPQWIRMSVATD